MNDSEPLQSGYFTPESVYSFGSATVVVFVVCNALQHAFSFNPRWLAFVLSQLIALGATIAANGFSFTASIVGFVNGCLVYCTAVGATQVAHGVKKPAEATAKGMPAPADPDAQLSGEYIKQRTFTTPWF